MITRTFLLLLFSALCLAVSPLSAQGSTSDASPSPSSVTPTATENYVVLTKKIPQLQPILLTAEHFRQEDGAAFGDFRIIICGQDIAKITDAETMQPFIDRAERLGAKIVACGFSLKKFKVDLDKVPAGIEIVDNGIQYNFTLQKKGYYSISL